MPEMIFFLCEKKSHDIFVGFLWYIPLKNHIIYKGHGINAQRGRLGGVAGLFTLTREDIGPQPLTGLGLVQDTGTGVLTCT